MIYQFRAYYGAFRKGKLTFFLDFAFEDCKKPVKDDTFTHEECESFIRKEIAKRGFNPEDYEYRWATQEEFNNRVFTESETLITVHADETKKSQG